MDESKPVNVDEATTHFSPLLDRAAAGEEVVIVRPGKPIAKLVPIPAQRARVPGRLKHLAAPPDSFFFDPLSEEELRLWEGTSEPDATAS